MRLQETRRSRKAPICASRVFSPEEIGFSRASCARGGAHQKQMWTWSISFFFCRCQHSDLLTIWPSGLRRFGYRLVSHSIASGAFDIISKPLSSKACYHTDTLRKRGFESHSCHFFAILGLLPIARRLTFFWSAERRRAPICPQILSAVAFSPSYLY